MGLTTFYLKGGQGLNFALPVEYLTELAAGKKPKPPARAAPESPPGPAASRDWSDRALVLIKAQDWRGLAEHCRRWTQAQKDNYHAWGFLGEAYYKLGRYREAIEAYREALRLKPGDAEAWNNLAIAYALSGNRSAALEAVKELRRYDPQKADMLFNLIMKP